MSFAIGQGHPSIHIKNSHLGGRAMSQETKNTRAYKNQKKNSGKEKKEQSKIRLVCIFPETASDAENVKAEVRSVLNLELQHQLQQRG